MTPAPLRVIYEISTLGFEFGHGPGMAGIYRVLFNLLREARSSSAVETRFAGLEHPWGESRAASALEYFWPGASASLVPAWQTPLSLGARRRLDQAAENGSRVRRAIARAVRKLVHARARRLAGDGAYDVFHSLTYALPRRDFGRSRVRFLTIQDLVPIKFPEYFGERGDFMRRHFTEVARSASSPTDWVITGSESTKRDYCDFAGGDPRKVFVTPWAAGPEFREEREPARLDAVRTKYALPACYILSLCTLEPRKNLAHLIRAFLEMLRADPALDVHLVLAGGKGWSFDEIFREHDGAGELRARIHCPGRIADDDLAAVYSAAELFVYPSLYEGFGLPPLEAMQCGVPVITSETSSLPEVVGDAGVTVAPTDQPALVMAMRSLLASAEERARCRARGLERARNFTWRRTMEQTVAAYQVALEAAARSSLAA